MSILSDIGKENTNGHPTAQSVSEAKDTPPAIDAREFVKVVESRRSVRKFTSEPIPPDVVRECLRLAHLAPTSSNLHQWEFHWIRTPDLRLKMNAICLGQPAASTAAEVIVCVARTATWKRNARDVYSAMEKFGPISPSVRIYYTRLVPFVYSIGLVSALAPLKWLIFSTVGLFKPMVRGPLGRAGLALWAVKSTALACENLMLAFRAFGYDTCPMEGFDEKRVKRLLHLDRDAHVVMVIGAGRRAPGGIYGPRIRLDAQGFFFER